MRRIWSFLAACALFVGVVGYFAGGPARAATMQTTIWYAAGTNSSTTFLTSSKTEVDKAIASGAYSQLDARFLATMTASSDTVAVHRLYSS